MGGPPSGAWLHTSCAPSIRSRVSVARAVQQGMAGVSHLRRAHSTPPLVRGLSNATGSVEHRAASSVPDYGPVAMEDGEGAPEGVDEVMQAQAKVKMTPQDADYASHKDHKKLLHEEDVTAPFHGPGPASASGLGYSGNITSGPRTGGTGRTGGQRSAGLHADARLMAMGTKGSQGVLESSPNPNLVMSRDPRYHNSFPRVPEYSPPVSPHGLIPVEPLARAGARAEAKIEAVVGHAGNLAVALTRGVFDLGGSILGLGQGRATSAPPAQNARSSPSIIPGDPTSANAPVTMYQKATNPATAAAHDPARMKDLPANGPHPNASPDLHGPASITQDRTPEVRTRRAGLCILCIPHS